jgi:hypothetical protein
MPRWRGDRAQATAVWQDVRQKSIVSSNPSLWRKKCLMATSNVGRPIGDQPWRAESNLWIVFSLRSGKALVVCAVLVAWATGCEEYQQGTGTGPGRRPQNLALTPNEELALGRQAFAEIPTKPSSSLLIRTNLCSRPSTAVFPASSKKKAFSRSDPLTRDLRQSFVK